MASSSTSAGVLPSAVERAVVSKGRLSTSSLSSPLILLHAAEPTSSSSSGAHKAQAFARHAHFLYHHLLDKLRDSSRYRGVVLVGLEDLPRVMHQPIEEDGQEGVLAALDGFALLPQTEDDSHNMHVVPPLDMSSAEAFVESIRRALPTQQASSPSTPSRSSSSSKKEGKDQQDEEKEEEENDDDQQDIALGIDSLNMLAHQLKSMPATIMALRKLLLHSSSSSTSGPSLSPLLAVLHSEGNNRHSLLSHTWRLALEDLATTNVFLYPHDEQSGRCLVVRKSASGKVHKEWESYSIDSNYGTVSFTSSSAASTSSTKQDKSTTAKATASTVGLTPANGSSSSSSKKEAAFLESLPFRLSLTEQEKTMRGQVVLPHERQRNEGGQTQQPLIYHEVEGGDEDEDEEEEEYNDDIDDDLDL